MKITISPFMNKAVLVFFLICLTLFLTCTKVTDITLEKRELTLFPGDEKTLSATVYPENAINKKIIWTSLEPHIATVNDVGTVKALSAGYTSIHATSHADSYHAALCAVVVHRANYIGDWDFVVKVRNWAVDVPWQWDTHARRVKCGSRNFDKLPQR